MSALTECIDAWVANDADRIAAAVAEDCIITERYGPVYRGRDCALRWAQAWFAAGRIALSTSGREPGAETTDDALQDASSGYRFRTGRGQRKTGI